MNKEEFLNSINVHTKIDEPFLLKIYGYELFYPGFAATMLERLEKLGFDDVKKAYGDVVNKEKVKWRITARDVYVDEYGIKANGIVTKIENFWDKIRNSKYRCQVEYVGNDKQKHEGTLYTNTTLVAGERVQIKYIPERYDELAFVSQKNRIPAHKFQKKGIPDMLRIKELLCDIVTETYGTDCNEKYLRFYVEISKTNSNSMHGKYVPKERKIVIYNTYRDDEAVLCTTIHELAHHIDCCNRGKSDHQKEFYAEYKKLLFTAMNMGIVKKEKFLETHRDASDSNKIRKMLEQYTPSPVSYKQNSLIISVSNAIAFKDTLKLKGYRFNQNTKAWEREISSIESDKELAFVSSLEGVSVEVTKATDLHFDGQIMLIAKGDTYAVKDSLKAAGFRYDKKGWVICVKNKEEAEKIKNSFPNLVFTEK